MKKKGIVDLEISGWQIIDLAIAGVLITLILSTFLEGVSFERQNIEAEEWCKSIGFNGSTNKNKETKLFNKYSFLSGQDYCYKYIEECHYNKCKKVGVEFEPIPEEAKKWWGE